MSQTETGKTAAADERTEAARSFCQLRVGIDPLVMLTFSEKVRSNWSA